MSRQFVLGSLLLVAVAGCGSFDEDMRTICNAPNEVKIEASDDPSARATKLAKHISERIRTDEAKSLFANLATLSPDQKRAKLEAAVKKAGITDCPFLTIVSAPPPAPQ